MKTLLVYSELSGFAMQLKSHIYAALEELQVEVKECYIDDVYRASEAFGPTMHIFMHHAHKIKDKLDVVNALRGHKLYWTMEDPYESDLTFEMLPHFYYIFTSDENTANELKKVGTNHVQYVPHAYNPAVHKPMDVTWEYKSDIAFIGNAYDSRLQYLSAHAGQWKDKLVRVVGVGYRGLDGFQTQHVGHGHISESEMMKYINGAKLVLNMHRQNEDLDMANKRGIKATSFNNRYYEVLACKRPQLVIGRGDDKLVENVDQAWLDKQTYKQRLVDLYLPLLKK